PNVIVKPCSRVAIKPREIPQVSNEPRQRQFLVIFACLRLDGQQRTPFCVQNKQQPIEENQAVFINSRQIGVCELVFRPFSKAISENFNEPENTVAKVFFKL